MNKVNYILILLILVLTSCSKEEKCESGSDISGNDTYLCCGSGLFTQSQICKCIDDYNKENGTNYESPNCR